jgi:signal transduction histidine kinase
MSAKDIHCQFATVMKKGPKPIRHPIRHKIFLVSLVPTMALLAAALINNQYLNALGYNAEQILSKNYKSIRAAQEARKILEEIRNPMFGQAYLGKHVSAVSRKMLTNELVDLSRLEVMSQPRPKETLDIAIVIRECLAPLMKQAEARGISIATDIPARLPQVTIDSFRFPWVITNLVGNALRYTDRGGQIRLTVHRQRSRFYFHTGNVSRRQGV